MSSRIGIVGGGQLGRMLSLSAKSLGFHVSILDPTPNSPAGQVADEQIVGDFRDASAVKQLASVSDFITFEIESANDEALIELSSKGYAIHPSPKTLSIIKDKLLQKQFLSEKGIPIADFCEVSSREDAIGAAERFKYPLLLKARFGAYDGRGNALVKKKEDIDGAFDKLGGKHLYAERFVSFKKELAMVVGRSTDGVTSSYPVVETVHKNNICHLVIAPAPISKDVAKKAKDLAVQVIAHLKGVGVFCIEMFLAENEEVLVNEIAPRVHNSGHYTIEAHRTSQFEQHVRMITGMSHGNMEMSVPYAVMINILGERQGPAEPQGIEEASKIPGAQVHLYGKLETRPERKMGHITVVGSNLEESIERARRARELVSI